ncbi:DNA mismatch repair protein Mlh3-like [Saccoglossus kowalevskii]|uniref:DNA mismatch repair protein Mlh3-like n=1 Tax=Saccoglossus kowalevskii TaxID=10224 RepID=A0ABM0LUU4_SACKO|nr:PREDICTED: DNA mismatch repair protein Mlh3-like [Saccoglossus kowalevskii]
MPVSKVMASTIQPLSDEVRSRLRSGIAITSLTQCVEELVLNSIDANATCIAVRVDIPCYKVHVIDNGTGITVEQMKLIGQRYATSKCHNIQDLENLSYYGFRGEALASICDVTGVLEIVSKAKSSNCTYCKLFKNGKPLEVFKAEKPRPSQGTTITVHDFFYNLPVRRKTMSPVLEFERVRQCLEGIALMRPFVSLSLRNDYTGVKTLQTHKSDSILGTFGQLFGVGKARIMKEMQYSYNEFTIIGHIGTDGHTNKNIQFIYVNGRLLLKTKLHKVVNVLLSKSVIVKSRATLNGTTLQTNQQRLGYLHPMFVLNIQCPLSEYDICLEPSKTLVEFKDWDGILLCLENFILEFLKRENLTMKLEIPNNLTELEALLNDEENNTVCNQKSDDVYEEELSGDYDQPKYNLSMFARNATHRYGKDISTENLRSTLQSNIVRRPFKQYLNELFKQTEDEADNEVDDEEDGANDGNTSNTDSNIAQVVECDGDAKTLEMQSNIKSDESHGCKFNDGKKNSADFPNKSDEVSCDDKTVTSMQHQINSLTKSPNLAALTKTCNVVGPPDKFPLQTKLCHGDSEVIISSSKSTQLVSDLAEELCGYQEPHTISHNKKIKSSSVKMMYDKLRESRFKPATERKSMSSCNIIGLNSYSHTSSLHQFKQTVSNSGRTDSAKRISKFFRNISRLDKTKSKYSGSEVARDSEHFPVMLRATFSHGLRSRFPAAKSHTKESYLGQPEKPCNASLLQNEAVATIEVYSAGKSGKETTDTGSLNSAESTIPTIETLKKKEVAPQPDLRKLRQKLTQKRMYSDDAVAYAKVARFPQPAVKKFATTESFIQTFNNGASGIEKNESSPQRRTDSVTSTQDVTAHTKHTLMDTKPTDISEKGKLFLQNGKNNFTIQSSVEFEESIQDISTVTLLTEKENPTQPHHFSDDIDNQMNDAMVTIDVIPKMETAELLPVFEGDPINSVPTDSCNGVNQNKKDFTNVDDERSSVADDLDAGDSRHTMPHDVSMPDIAVHKVSATAIDNENCNNNVTFSDIEELGHNWISKFDVSLGKRIYVDLMTGLTRLVPPSKEETQPPETRKQSETGTSSTICTSMKLPDQQHRVHPFLSHNATPFLPLVKDHSNISQSNDAGDGSGGGGGGGVAVLDKSTIGTIWDEHLVKQSEDVASKWRDDKTNKISESKDVAELFAEWENPMFAVPESCISDASNQPVSRQSVRIRGAINQYKFTKAMLDNIKMCGQVDDKFIACLVKTTDKTDEPNLLVLIDQHAAHERVRLEQLTADVYDDSKDDEDPISRKIRSSRVIPAVTIILTPGEIRIMEAFKSNIEKLGVTFNITGSDIIEIHTLPACLMEREVNEVKRGRQPVALSIVETLLKEHIDLLQKTSGACAVLPRTLTKVLNSQACHGAIKFGDALDHHECTSLIRSLSHCDLPFQCAHGRPSLMPIIDLDILRKQLDTEKCSKPKLWKLKHLMDKESEMEQ